MFAKQVRGSTPFALFCAIRADPKCVAVLWRVERGHRRAGMTLHFALMLCVWDSLVSAEFSPVVLLAQLRKKNEELAQLRERLQVQNTDRFVHRRSMSFTYRFVASSPPLSVPTDGVG